MDKPLRILVVDDERDILETLDYGLALRGFAVETDQIVVTAGVPFNKAGTTNILRVAPCEERLIFATDPD